MGGSGSGRWHSCGAKTTTESQRRVDIRWMKRQGYLEPGVLGSISWMRGDEPAGLVGFRTEAARMVLNYSYRPVGGQWSEVEQVINFGRTTCNFGGHRVWLFCPRCFRRVVVLYLSGTLFMCRHCSNLAYDCQQETKVDRLMRKARKIRRRLVADMNLSMPIWLKPKFMHGSTFDRLKKEAEHANSRSWHIMAQRLGIRIDSFL